MRTLLLVSAFLLLMSNASFAQHSNEPIVGGTTNDGATAPARKKPAAKPAAKRSAPLYSLCGVYYENRADMVAESRLTDKWFSIGQSANKHFWYNPRKTNCEVNTNILKSWIKEEHKNTDGDYALVLYEMKCKPNQLRVKTVIEYDKTGSVLQTTNNDDAWQDAAPKTAGEVMIRTACRRPSQ